MLASQEVGRKPRYTQEPPEGVWLSGNQEARVEKIHDRRKARSNGCVFLGLFNETQAMQG